MVGGRGSRPLGWVEAAVLGRERGGGPYPPFFTRPPNLVPPTASAVQSATTLVTEHVNLYATSCCGHGDKCVPACPRGPRSAGDRKHCSVVWAGLPWGSARCLQAWGVRENPGGAVPKGALETS